MSMIDVNELEKRVERAQKVEGLKDELLKRVDAFLAPRRQAGGQPGNQAYRAVPGAVGDTQFQDLVRKSCATTSVGELVNFLQYQIGRAGNNRGWAENSFGEDLVQQIRQVSSLAGNDAQLRMELVSLFLGYLHRQVKYVRAKLRSVGA